MTRVLSCGKPVAQMLKVNFIRYIKQKHLSESQEPSKITTNVTYILPRSAKDKLTPSEQESLPKSIEGNQSKNKQSVPILCTDTITLGIHLGTFLYESGWLAESVEVLSIVSQYLMEGISLMPSEFNIRIARLDCFQRYVYCLLYLKE